MSGMDGPGPNERDLPDGSRTPGGVRIEEDGTEDPDPERAVLSALVDNQPGVLAEVTGLFARRQVNIERLVGEPIGDGKRSRITFVVAPPHPGVKQVTRQLEKLRPVVTVEKCDLERAEQLTAGSDGF